MPDTAVERLEAATKTAAKAGRIMNRPPTYVSVRFEDAEALLSQLRQRGSASEHVLRQALAGAARAFRDYQALHLAKDTADGREKAARNRSLAEMCEAALVTTPAGGEGERASIGTTEAEELWLKQAIDPDYAPNKPSCEMSRDLLRRLLNRLQQADAEADEAHQIGQREGYEEAVQDIDLLTGGDGEYRYCTNGNPERHCPDAATMKARIVERFCAAPASPLGEADHIADAGKLIAPLGEGVVEALGDCEAYLRTPNGDETPAGAAIRNDLLSKTRTILARQHPQPVAGLESDQAANPVDASQGAQ